MRIEKNDGSFYFLLKLVELGGGEKLAECDIEAVAELFDGRDGNFPPAWVEQTVHGRRGHARNVRKRVRGNAPFTSQPLDALRNCVLD